MLSGEGRLTPLISTVITPYLCLLSCCSIYGYELWDELSLDSSCSFSETQEANFLKEETIFSRWALLQSCHLFTFRDPNCIFYIDELHSKDVLYIIFYAAIKSLDISSKIYILSRIQCVFCSPSQIYRQCHYV